MKGKVLGFDPASGTGAINGEDGKRYKFAAADNKSPAPLKANDSVDFEAAEDAAREIYAVKSGFSIPSVGDPATGASNIDLSAMAANPAVASLLARPYVIWGAVIILGSLIAGYFGALEALSEMSGMMGLGFSAIFVALLFLVPVIAAVLIFFEFTNHKMTAQFRLIAAAAAIGGPIILPIVAGMALGTSGDILGRRMPGVLGLVGFHIDLGMLITVAGGVLIILTNMGIVKLPKG